MTQLRRRLVPLLVALFAGCQPVEDPEPSGPAEPPPGSSLPDAGPDAAGEQLPDALSAPDAGADAGSSPRRYTIGGAVDGLAGSGLVLRLTYPAGAGLTNTKAVDLSITASGTFTFPVDVANGTAYTIGILHQQDDVFQGCMVQGGTGTVSGEDVTSVTVHCQRHRLAFVTSASGLGNLSSWALAGGKAGLAAGDQICQTIAGQAGLTGTFVAWLSDGANDAYCRVHGLPGKKSALCGQVVLPTAAGPWVRTDGARFADRIDLALPPTNAVLASVSVDEAGLPLAATTYHTGTGPDGARSTATGDTACVDWTSNVVPQAAGFGKTDVAAEWSFSGVSVCKVARHLLCLETGPGVSF